MKPLASEQLQLLDETFERLMSTRATALDVLSEVSSRIGRSVHHAAIVCGPERMLDMLEGIIDSIEVHMEDYEALHDGLRRRVALQLDLEKT